MRRSSRSRATRTRPARADGNQRPQGRRLLHLEAPRACRRRHDDVRVMAARRHLRRRRQPDRAQASPHRAELDRSGSGAGRRRRTAASRPVIKPPVWKPEIPFYFYAGRLAGGSAGLALLAELRGETALAGRTCMVAAAGSVASPAPLISDLGMPRQFLHMLRMFKITSPMSVGAWILAGFVAATAPATLHSHVRQALADRRDRRRTCPVCRCRRRAVGRVPGRLPVGGSA